ncbi:MAG: metal-dependent hydrolase [Gemmatimonadaceae bacterium]
MDLFTHGATGAFIGWALPQRRAGLAAAALVVAGALLPDADVFVEPFVGPRSAFAHRGFTHSLLGVAVLAPLVALVAWRFSKERRFARLVPLIAIGMLSHVLLDLPTPMGVMLFSPSRKDVHLDFLGYVDWTLFTVALAVLLAAWTYAKRDAAMRRGILSAVLLSALSWWLYAEWPSLAFSFAATVEEATEEPLRTVYPLVLCGILLGFLVAFAQKGWGFRQNRAQFGRIGVSALSMYLALCLTAQGLALGQIGQFSRERGILVWRRAASRMGYTSLVGPLRWTGLVLAPEGVYLAQIMPLGAQRPTFTFFPTSSDNAFVARTRSIPEVRGFLSVARFPVARYRLEKGQHIVEYQDYGLSWRPLLRVVLNERQEVLAVGRIAH